jgi:ribosomal protein S18 acetylase RimI-like enzyme
MSQMSEDIQYQPMSLERHDLRDIANLIRESAPELFAVMFGPWAIACLAMLVLRSHNRFSHRYIYVAEIAQRVVGLIILVPTANLNDAADYRDVLNVAHQLWLKLLQRLVLRHVLQHDYPAGSLYIGNLAVAAEYRNRGIGRQLLSHCLDKAACTSSPIYISVDISNGRAQKLYESLGFKLFATKVIRLLWVSIGVQILSK